MGWAAIGASDRMLTNSDVEYEPPQTKFCALTKHTMLLTAGEMHIHSEAIRATQRRLQNAEFNPADIAELHAQSVRDLRSRFAAQEILAPLGLDHAGFLSRQRDMDPDLVTKIANQLAKYRFDIETIIFGLDAAGSADVFHIDGDGIATRHSDIGFLSIGIGADHANLQFMSLGYSRHVVNYYQALAMVYAAKKSAEIAPGVGKSTDMTLITRGGWESIRPQTMEALDGIYTQWMSDRDEITQNAITKVESYFVSLASNQTVPVTQSKEGDIDKPTEEKAS